MNLFALLIKRGFWALLSLLLSGLAILALIILFIEARLPNTETLKTVQMQLPLRVYTNDGYLIGMFGEKRRIPITLEQVPKPLINAVLATEDQRFFDHPGVDLLGLMRAAIEVLRTGTKSQGGSTITMQVARNFFLSREKSYIRKLNEVLLAIKIDNTLSKEKILELYLNQIYFGNRAYGVAAAAEVYYGKTLDQLTLPEIAMIAGLPKAPSTLNPLANPQAALERRNHVLERMLVQNYIDEATYKDAIATPPTARYHQPQATIKAPYIAEMVRQIMVDRLGEDAYTKGYKVYTTIDSQLQLAANQALRNELLNYDRRHGYRNPKINLRQLSSANHYEKWINYLKTQRVINGLWPAVIINTNNSAVKAILADGETITMSWASMAWTGRAAFHAVVKTGDVIRVTLQTNGNWELAQIPQIEGSLIAINPMDGAIKALVGGFDYASSSFNRAIQAERQPGSSFKPFIYSAALEKGFTLASVINDAPIVMSDPSLPHLWRPQNDTRKFYGPTRLRVALAHSRNLVSIRLLQSIGIEYAVEYVQRFGFSEQQLPKSLSFALGTASVTPLQLTAGFTVFANGGYKVTPYVIQRITDASDRELSIAHPKIACDSCKQQAPMVIPAQNAYLITAVLQEVIKSGTGRAALALKRPDLAGKTGTSQDQKDAWFIGFNSDIVVGSWAGYDQPRTTHEHGAQIALPMWMNFMSTALKGKAPHTMAQPPGITTVKIDPATGLLADAGQVDAIDEIFREEDVPTLSASTNDDNGMENDEQESDQSDDNEQGNDPLF